jgi:hypothetical protein
MWKAPKAVEKEEMEEEGDCEWYGLIPTTIVV